jgi:hypothetical protein
MIATTAHERECTRIGQLVVKRFQLLSQLLADSRPFVAPLPPPRLKAGQRYVTLVIASVTYRYDIPVR